MKILGETKYEYAKDANGIKGQNGVSKQSEEKRNVEGIIFRELFAGVKIAE